MEHQRIARRADLRKYRTELPNCYDDANLDPYEFRLLAHYVRVGNCFESTRTTAEKCRMSGATMTLRFPADAPMVFIAGQWDRRGNAIFATFTRQQLELCLRLAELPSFWSRLYAFLAEGVAITPSLTLPRRGRGAPPPLPSPVSDGGG